MWHPGATLGAARDLVAWMLSFATTALLSVVSLSDPPAAASGSSGGEFRPAEEHDNQLI